MTEVSLDADSLWFVCCVSNPCGYMSRINLYNDFVRHVMKDLEISLMTVECAYNDHPYLLMDEGKKYESEAVHHMHVPVRSNSVLWHKENILNAGIKKLPPHVQYVVWCDADLVFMRGKEVKNDIMNELKKCPFVQCFSTTLDLDPTGDVMKVHHGFGFSQVHKIKAKNDKFETYDHSGYVWAATRELLADVGGLLDVGIVGSGDRMMAMASVGRISECCNDDYHADYNNAMMAWQEKLLRHTNGNVSYVKGVLKHQFHGYKEDRQYTTRPQILKNHKYSPLTDLVLNEQGVYEWTPDKPKLHADVHTFFLNRKEDIAITPK